MTDLKCSECGCTIPPDATKCPNCGHKYGDVSAKVPSKNNGNGITVSCVGYATRCPVHGKIYIRVSMASASIKCPFCIF